MKSSVVIVSVCVAVLVGCAVGPDYEKPKTSTPSQWNSSLEGGETNSPVALAEWWKNFGDTNLDAYIVTAIQSNLTLRVAEAHVREARAQKGIVSANLWPSIGAGGAYSKNRYSANTFPALPPGTELSYNLYDANFDAVWELDVFGGTRRAVQAASAQIGSAEYSQRDVLISLLAEVAKNYISARAYQERLAIAQHNIEVEQDVLDLTSNRYESGLGSDLDVEQSKALLSTTESQVPSLEIGFDESVRALAVLLGQQPDTLMDQMTAKKDIPITPPLVPVGLPSELLLRRPDVQRAELDLAAATAQIGVAKSDLYPKFSLTGIAGLQSTSAGDWFHWASRYWSAGPTVQWEIFEAGSITANIHVQNARQEEALNTYQQTVLVALEDTENALTAYAKEQVRRESLKQSVDANQTAFDLSTELYKSGLADFIRVLNAETQLFITQDALVESDQNVSQDLVQLYKALGGGWEETETNMAPSMAAAH
ncbi:MAG TPA: efflux transporter outer membrane subunit [Pseudomonadales bacterium]|nr:efflux transporter outer membrane subunit [Pseudomonadales bacterium]